MAGGGLASNRGGCCAMTAPGRMAHRRRHGIRVGGVSRAKLVNSDATGLAATAEERRQVQRIHDLYRVEGHSAAAVISPRRLDRPQLVVCDREVVHHGRARCVPVRRVQRGEHRLTEARCTTPPSCPYGWSACPDNPLERSCTLVYVVRVEHGSDDYRPHRPTVLASASANGRCELGEPSSKLASAPLR